jgi:hypothetical protein
MSLVLFIVTVPAEVIFVVLGFRTKEIKALLSFRRIRNLFLLLAVLPAGKALPYGDYSGKNKKCYNKVSKRDHTINRIE